jgi:hypothetical protein
VFSIEITCEKLYTSIINPVFFCNNNQTHKEVKMSLGVIKEQVFTQIGKLNMIFN